jgi:hypothetical protein
LLSKVLLLILLPLVYLTSTLIPTVDGQLRSSKVFFSKSSVMLTAIAQRTRRGKGNVVMCSADVASALSMAGVLDYTPALNANLNVDDTGNTFAGVQSQGKYRVYIDPYSANLAADNCGLAQGTNQYYVVGYKGSSPYDAGLFYCPYVPLQMVRAVGENSFQPKIGFKTQIWSSLLTHSQKALTRVLADFKLTANRYYQKSCKSRTSCDIFLTRSLLGIRKGSLFLF